MGKSMVSVVYSLLLKATDVKMASFVTQIRICLYFGFLWWEARWPNG